jgi:hypothetical protein
MRSRRARMPASEPWKPVEFGYVLAMWVAVVGFLFTKAKWRCLPQFPCKREY